MRVGLHGLLEGPHFLDFHKLATPAAVEKDTLLALHFQLFLELFLLLLHVLDFLPHFFNFLNLRILVTSVMRV